MIAKSFSAPTDENLYPAIRLKSILAASEVPLLPLDPQSDVHLLLFVAVVLIN